MFEQNHDLSPTRIQNETIITSEITQDHLIDDQISSQLALSNDLANSGEVRTASWEKALGLVVTKNASRQEIQQNLRPVEYNEPIIHHSLVVDDRILESYSPQLKNLLLTGKIHPHAVFSIIEHFLRQNPSRFSSEQLEYISTIFRPQKPGESFKQYKNNIENIHQGTQLPNISPEESWGVRREIMDLMELMDNYFESYLKLQIGQRTIFVTDLARIAEHSLQSVHQINQPGGIDIIKNSDIRALSGNETTWYRNVNQEILQAFRRHPNVLLGLLSSRRQENILDLAHKLFVFPDAIFSRGVEYIPRSGPAIIAFSHMNRWLDPTAPPNWELFQMLGALRQLRSDPSNLVAYLDYFKDTAPKGSARLVAQPMSHLISKAKSSLGINFIDVSGEEGRIQRFTQESLDALSRGELLIIAPEGAPAAEVLRPKRGVGVIARLSGAPVIGVAFLETRSPDNEYTHQVIFTPPLIYPQSTDSNHKETDQTFSDAIMRQIALQIPPHQRGFFR